MKTFFLSDGRALLLTALPLFIGLHLHGQAPCPPPDCNCLVERAQKAAKDNDYTDAIRQYNAAMQCAPKRKQEFNRRIEDLFLRIDAQRIEAEGLRAKALKTQEKVDIAAKRAAFVAAGMQQQKRDAEKLKQVADSLRGVSEASLLLAGQKRDSAEAEAARTRKALGQLQTVFTDLTDLFLQEARDSILALRFDAALERARESAFLHVSDRMEAVGRLSFELAYVFNEACQKMHLPALTDTLCALLPYPPRPDTAGDCRPAFRTWLAAADISHFNTLERRYYPTMITIAGGAFQMGTDESTCRALEKELLASETTDSSWAIVENYFNRELPAHQVTLDTFQLAKTETTWYQYGLFCMATQRALPRSPSWGVQGDHPVVNASWNDAQEYGKWLNTQIAGGHRLPTEAEWEYAARGGQTGAAKNLRHAGGNYLDQVGWYDQNAGGTTHPVGEKKPNSLGLYDMSGNVWEWCADWYGDYGPNPATNPTGPTSGSLRVGRGGSWYDDPTLCRVAYRNGGTPDYRDLDLGFRLARTF